MVCELCYFLQISSVFRWNMHRSYTYLLIVNKLPIVYRRANFLAFSSSRGVYIAAKTKHRSPNIMQAQNPIILWIRLWKGRSYSYTIIDHYKSEKSFVNKLIITSPVTKLGQQSFCASDNHVADVSSLLADFVNHLPTSGFDSRAGIVIFNCDLLSFLDK